MISPVYKLFVFLSFALSLGMSAQAGPITPADQVVVNGTTWVQMDLFTNLSWNDMNAICPGGVCVDGGTLNGYEMTGFYWASLEDVNALFNYFIGSNLMGPGETFISPGTDSWATSFFNAGFRPTYTSPPQNILRAVAFMHDSLNSGTGLLSATGVIAQLDTLSMAQTDITRDPSFSNWDAGGFFYQYDSPSEAPTPATVSLLGLGLAALGYSRRNRRRQN